MKPERIYHKPNLIGRRFAIVFLLVLVTLSRGSLAQDAIKQADVDSLVEPLIENNDVVALVIGVVHNGEQQVFTYGSLLPNGTERPSSRTIFEIGSITKTFTGLLLAQLAEEGTVQLNDPISKYLPAGTPTPRWGQDEIRLIDLATHTSGLPRMPTNLVPRDVSNLYADYSSDQLLAYLKYAARGNAGRSLLSTFKPTPQPSHNYSNLGIGLLGYLLSRAANKPYEQLLIEKVCDPLGLDDTRVELSEEQRARLAPGHSSRKMPAPNWKFECLAPCAGLNSTCEDMLKYLSVFLDRQNGMVKSAELTLQQHRPIDANNSIGLCWLVVSSVLDDLIFCSVFESPPALELATSASFVVDAELIEDWMIRDGNIAYGGFSMRVVRSRLPITERRRFDEYTGIQEFKEILT